MRVRAAALTLVAVVGVRVRLNTRAVSERSGCRPRQSDFAWTNGGTCNNSAGYNAGPVRMRATATVGAQPGVSA